MDIKIIQEVLEKLKQSPLFYLFCSSKELFHSNFLYWMSQQNKRAFYNLFYEIDPTDEVSSIEREVTRNSKIKYDSKKETAKLDFELRTNNGKTIIIENKVKDIAKNEQLERIYKATNKDSNTKYVLLTLTNIESNLPKPWIKISYEELSQKIEAQKFVEETKENYYYQLIKDYKIFLNTLSKLFVELTPNTDEYNFAISFQKVLFKVLNSYKLWETYQKICANNLLQVFNKENPSPKYHTRYFINHQKATIDFFIELKNEIEMGVQLEDNQYRKYIVAKGNAEKYFQKLYENKKFFLDEKFRSKKTPYEKFLKYGNYFRYQYKEFEDNNDKKFNTLFPKIINDLDYLLTNQNQIENLLFGENNE